MGICGLLPLMKNAGIDVKLSKLEGSVAAVDTNGWIHRACYSCGDKIYMNEPTEVYINYCINLCELLRSHRITPILVFDGQSLPAKAETKAARQKRKQQVRDTIEELLRSGNVSKARYLMRTCADVTFEMIKRVIDRCREERIDYLLAPYEADAQITFLVNQGLADFAITEDSDMLAFGCQRTLYKLDREAERGRLIDLSRLSRCFKNFGDHGKDALRRFQYMCILSGCDYLSNLPGIAIGRARKFFETTNIKIDGIDQMLRQVPITLKMKDKVQVTQEYIKDFYRALNTFDFQIVYSPFLNDLTYLNSLPSFFNEDISDLASYAGQFFSENYLKKSLKNNLKFVTNYVLGNVDPKTLQLIDNYNPFDDLKTTDTDFLDEKFHWYSDVIIDRLKKSSDKDFKLNFLGLNRQSKPSENKETELEINNQMKKQSSWLMFENDETNHKSNSQLTSISKKTNIKTRNSIFNQVRITSTIRRSKYFQNTESKKTSSQKDFENNDEDGKELKEIFLINQQVKRKSAKTKEQFNTSASSIDEEESIVLKKMNCGGGESQQKRRIY